MLCQFCVFIEVVWFRSFSWVGDEIGFMQFVVSCCVCEFEVEFGLKLIDCMMCDV